MIVLPGVVVVAIAAALAYIFTSGGSHASASGTQYAVGAATPSASPSAAPAHAPNRASANEPKNAAALAASGGALTVQPAHSAAAAKWAAGSGGAALTTLSRQVGAVTQSAGVHQYANMKAACVKLADGVKTAQAAAPIPQASMQARYAAGLADLARGAADCQAAISEQTDGDEYVITHENSALLNQSKAAFVAGAKALFQGTSEIEVLSRQR